jgi:branched-chain amino acid transport system ATP-binding protein
MSAPLLAVDGLFAGYGAVGVLHGVSLAVAPGSVTALIGGNGAGKTTLMRVLAGALPPARGTIAFDGTPLARLAACRRVAAGLVLVPEGRLIFPQMTVEENLRIGGIAVAKQGDAGARLAAVYELFPRLAERRRQLGGTLSGGEQQMLAIGRGLMAAPRLLLLDEPTLGLAPLMVREIFATIARLRDGGTTILLAEQDVPRTLGIADRAYVIENGRVAFSGAGRELLGDARVRSSYLGL